LTRDTCSPRSLYAIRVPSLSLTAILDAIGVQNLIDVRSPDEFAGRLLAPAHLPQEAAQIGGHIPTAGNVPWSKAANDDGTFRSDDEPVGNAYVRLLDRNGEFTAEVPTSTTGQFRFFAAAGSWTLRTLAPRSESVDRQVVAELGSAVDVAIDLNSVPVGA